MRKLFPLPAVAALLLPATALGATWQIDPAHSAVKFSIKNMFRDVQGSFTKFSGTLEGDEKSPARAKVSAVIATDSINTRNERRDAHLRTADFFDATKYPKITFKSRKVTLKKENRATVLGELTMHGLTKPALLDVEYKGQTAGSDGAKHVTFAATTTLSRKAFDIGTGTRGSAALVDEVKVTLEIQAVLQASK